MSRITWVLLFMLANCWAATGSRSEQSREHGTVNMHGSILITPCAINMPDEFQSIDLGVVTTGEFQHEGRGPGRPFSIHLINCNLETGEPENPTASWFQVTFDGKDDASLFGLQGISGAGIEITDMQGHVAHLGEPMPANRIVGRSMTLNYVLWLAADHHALQAGKYRTTIRYKIDYF